MSDLRSGYDGYRRGDHDDFDAVSAYVEALEAEVKRLTNKLNEDSQTFQIECQKAEIEMLRKRIPDPNGLRLVLSMAEEHLERRQRKHDEGDYYVDEGRRSANAVAYLSISRLRAALEEA